MRLRARQTDDVRRALRELIAAEMAYEIGTEAAVAGHAQRVEQARRRYDAVRMSARQNPAVDR